MSLFIVTIVTMPRLLPADDQAASSDGSKIVPITIGGKTVPIKVEEAGDPFKNVSSSSSDGKYDPQRIFSTASSYANKSFLPPTDSISQGNADFKDTDRNTFITKPYLADSSAPTAPDLNTKASFATTSADSRSNSDFDKNYSTSSADLGQNPSATLASATSSDQGRSAVLGGQATSTYESPLAGKAFQGPEADAARQHLSRLKNGQILITDLPNRPLTIDEVRDLINHGFKPNTDVAPPEASKPLNDPDYKPQPLRDTPPPAADDDKNDPVPPPGTMAAPAAPENSEPLPQQP